MDLLLHKFYIGDIIGSMLQPTEGSPQSEWIYAYSRNQTLLNMTPEQLMKKSDLKIYYMQMDSTQKCMPVGGPIGYDIFMIYTFINMVGYGEDAGFLKTWLRKEGSQRMLDIDFSEDLVVLGSSGDGIWSHITSKIYVLFDCLSDLSFLLILVLISSKVLLHSLARMQTK